MLRMTEADVFGIDSGFGNFKYTSTNDCCLHVRTWTHFQGIYFCHVPGHICLLSPPPEECLKVGECLFVIPGQCLPPVFTFLGQTFLALSIMSWHKRDWGVVSLIESRVSSGPVDHPQTAKSLRVKCTFWISFTVCERRKNELST